MQQGDEFSALKDLLHDYSPVETASVFSGFLLDPEYQPHIYRIEFAIKASLSLCKGEKKPTRKLIRNIFKEIEKTGITIQEDPPEDVFVSTLYLGDKYYKVLLGLWEGAIPQTQIFLNILQNIPKDKYILELYERIEKLLVISDRTIELNMLPNNCIGNKYSLENIPDRDSKDYRAYQKKVFLKFNPDLFDEKFTLIDDEFSLLLDEEFGNTILEEKPIYLNENNIVLLLPTAITISIRRHIINSLVSHMGKKGFISVLQHYQAKNIQDIRIFGEFYKAPVKFYKVGHIDSFLFSEVLIEFDKGYFYHFIFVMDSLEKIEEDWFAGFVISDNEVSVHIGTSIEKAKKLCIEQNEYAKGCSIVVPCGYGRGLAIGIDYKSDDAWGIESINIDDLATISNDQKCTPHLIWRMFESISKLNGMGTELINPNGFLNLYSYIKNNGYSLLFEQDVESSHLINVMLIPTNSHLGLREEILQSIDKRIITHPEFGKLIVRRAFSESYFGDSLKSVLYMPEDLDKKVFRVVYLDNSYTIWIEQKLLKDVDFRLQYKIFDAATYWLCKIMEVLARHHIIIEKSLKIWKLDFEIPLKLDELKNDVNKDEILSSSSNLYIDGVLLSNFNITFIKGLASEENHSEQALIIAFLQYLSDSGASFDLKVLLEEIIGNEAAKHMHFFVANKYREFFITDDDNAIYIENIDEEIIKLNLGWSIRDREDGNIIHGKNECKQYLNKLVGKLWELLQVKLKLLDRASLVEALLKNIEICTYEINKWRRTFKAVLSLEASNETTAYEVATKKISQMIAATVSSRLVIEMAICESSVNCGKEAGTLDIQELICLASFLHHLGGLSEAINYDAIPAELKITSFGDILYDQTFNDRIIGKYGEGIHKKQLQNSIENYSDNFVVNKSVKEVNHLLEKEFLEAFVDEFGYTIDDIRRFLDFLEDYGLKRNELVFQIPQNELINQFAEKEREIFTIILDSLIIYPRNDWTNIPHPYKKNDWQPWRFKRRYSITMKPVVQIDTFEKFLLISPQLVRDSFFNLLRNCYEAYLDEEHFTSKIMQRWIGSSRAKRGLDFNITVSEELEKLGLSTRVEVKLTEILNKKMEDFGDVDVLAWDDDKNIVYVIECKDLEFAKTYGEIAKQLYDFKGKVNSHGKKDRLLKHVKRIEELKKDINGLAKYTKLNPSNLEIRGLIVFSATVPMVFDEGREYIDEIEFLSFDELEKLKDEVN